MMRDAEEGIGAVVYHVPLEFMMAESSVIISTFGTMRSPIPLDSSTSFAEARAKRQ
jgi:hypothetical protein